MLLVFIFSLNLENTGVSFIAIEVWQPQEIWKWLSENHDGLMVSRYQPKTLVKQIRMKLVAVVDNNYCWRSRFGDYGNLVRWLWKLGPVTSAFELLFGNILFWYK
jgi:hypothetical protein